MPIFFTPFLRWIKIFSSQEICGGVILPEVVSMRPHAETGPVPLGVFFFLRLDYFGRELAYV